MGWVEPISGLPPYYNYSPSSISSIFETTEGENNFQKIKSVYCRCVTLQYHLCQALSSMTLPSSIFIVGYHSTYSHEHYDLRTLNLNFLNHPAARRPPKSSPDQQSPSGKSHIRISLEPDDVPLIPGTLLSLTPRNRDNGHEIHEPLTTLLIIHEPHLRLFPSSDLLSQHRSRFAIDVRSHGCLPARIGALQKSAVASQDLRAEIACERLEWLGTVDDGAVGHGGVAEHEWGGAVDVP